MGCRILESEYYSALSREGFCIANRDLSTNGTKLHESGVAFSLCEKIFLIRRPESDSHIENYCPAGSNVAAESVQVVYDALGRQSQVVEARGTTDYVYDTEGRLTQLQTPEGALNNISGVNCKSLICRFFPEHMVNLADGHCSAELRFICLAIESKTGTLLGNQPEIIDKIAKQF